MRALFILFLSTCAVAQQYVISTLAGGAAPPTPLPANQASIGDPARVIADSAGNLYFAALHSIFKIDTAGNLTRFAGNGRSGNSGDFGPATSAQLSNPMGMAFDGAGNLYVADRDANVVRRIAAGVISTVAVGLNQPLDVAIDSRGGLYVADTGNNRVVRAAADGTLAAVAGAGGELNRPEGLAIDSNDNLYIADTFNGLVRRLTPEGHLSTVAGTGSTGVFAGDHAPAVSAALSLPTALAVDAQGSLYIADFGNARVRVVTGGIINTIAGSSNGAPILDGEPAFSTRLEGPTGVTVDRSGTVYFVEGGIGSGTGLARGDYRVWKIAPTGELRAVAGTGAASFAGDGGPASAAQFNSPAAMSFDGIGNLFITDTANHRVRRIDPDGNIATILGNGTPGFAVDFGSPAGALLHSPGGIAADAGGTIYVADTLNNRVRRYQPGGNVVTYAGNGNASYFGDNGPATSAAINAPEGIVLDAGGNLYIADTSDNAVRKVTPSGVITTIAGNGLMGFAGDGGPGTRAQLNHPRAVAVDSAGNVYIADTGNHRVRRVDSAGDIATIAGNGTPDFLPGDSAGAESSLDAPRGVAVDASGNVYISDTGHNRIRKLFPSGAITTIAGYDGSCCYSGDGGLALSAQLNRPAGLMVTDSGIVYIADTGNNAIRTLRPVASNATISAATNAASNLSGPVAPGELVTLYGAGFDAVKSVSFNGLSARVLYATTSQVGVAVPYALTGSTAQVTVATTSASSAPLSVQVGAVAPGLFTADASGRGQALALNQDGTRNGTGKPITAGQVLTLYVTGEGQTNPPGVDGRVGAATAPVPLAPVTVTIGGAPGQVQYAGGAPGLIAGVMQVNVLVPDKVFGTVPVVVSVARVPTQAGVTIAVQ